MPGTMTPMTNHDTPEARLNRAYEAELRRINAGGAIDIDALLGDRAGDTFACMTCFDTRTIDQGGREVPCPDCPVTVKLTGLAHGLGDEGQNYNTAVAWTTSTITLVGTREAILRDVVARRANAEQRARMQHLTGRNHVSSGAIAIERRVRKALA